MRNMKNRSFVKQISKKLMKTLCMQNTSMFNYKLIELLKTRTLNGHKLKSVRFTVNFPNAQTNQAENSIPCTFYLYVCQT